MDYLKQKIISDEYGGSYIDLTDSYKEEFSKCFFDLTDSYKEEFSKCFIDFYKKRGE